jgi:DNA-binding response OmpR family regulator
VLLAEDDADLRALLASALRDDGYEVVEACDGGRLLVRLAREYVESPLPQGYDLLVTDLRMPICSGLQILEKIRGAGWTTPAIVMTAFGDEPMRARVEALGASMFSKPFDVDELRTALRRIFAVAKAQPGAR